MTNYKNKINIKSLNDNNQPLFEDYKEDKIIKPVPRLKGLSVESKSEGSSKQSLQAGNVTAKPSRKTGEIKKSSKSSSNLINNNGSLPLSLGIYLQEARVIAGYSLSQVAMITKLNIHYIEAMERDDFKNTPPLIYVKAYIKKLTSLYNIDSSKALSLLKSFDKTGKIISNSILQDLQETKQINQKDEEKVKIIFKISAIVLSVIIFFGIVSGLFLWLSSSGSDDVGKSLTPSEKAATVKNMEKLIIPQSISLTELPLNSKK